MTWCVRLIRGSNCKFVVAENEDPAFTHRYIDSNLTFMEPFNGLVIPQFHRREEAEAVLMAAKIKGIIP